MEGRVTMNDQILKLLNEPYYDEDEVLTDAEVDEYLSNPVECPSETLQRIRARIIEKLLRERYPKPIAQAEGTPFGRWIEEARKKTGISTEALEEAIGKKKPYVERLESGALLPWKLPAVDIARLACLFRIHIQALHQMVSASHTVSQTSLTGEIMARSQGGRISKERGDATKRALDLFLARNASKPTLSIEIENWLKDVQANLEKSNSKDLIQ
jgi:transcriptional regulator with XRE-family HTH domain